MYGAPGRLGEGQVEAGVSFGGTPAGVALTVPSFAVGVRDWVSLEVGGSANLFGGWALGFVVPRFTWVPHREASFHFVGDLELGVGAGAGGDDRSTLDPKSDFCMMDPSYCDGRTPWDRFAYGAYQGFGIGATEGRLTLFLRVRIEETSATNMPLTLWPQGALGFEVRLWSHLSLSFGVGAVSFVSFGRDPGHWIGIGLQGGFTFFLDAWHRSFDRQFQHDHPDSALYKN